MISLMDDKIVAIAARNLDGHVTIYTTEVNPPNPTGDHVIDGLDSIEIVVNQNGDPIFYSIYSAGTLRRRIPAHTQVMLYY